MPGPAHSEPLLHLAAIMAYLKPGGRYEYQTSANFGKLLKNPLQEKLIGDCNQIVTLYAFLYSLKFPLSDLQIKILPGHVCLHFQGIDIEATNASFQHYADKGEILPITELLSTNLLDINDAEARTATIDPRTMLKRAQLAYHLSSFRDIVTRNLNASYQQLIASLLQQKKYASAVFYAEKLADPEWIKKVYRHATSDALARSDFSQAETYINRSGDGEMREILQHNQGIYYYKKGQFEKALFYFQKEGNADMVKACYQRQYSELAKRVQSVKTLAEAKRYHSTYQKMLALARNGGMEEASESVQRILRQI
jgi:tetratricopeptide (TPR) repeat protein